MRRSLAAASTLLRRVRVLEAATQSAAFSAKASQEVVSSARTHAGLGLFGALLGGGALTYAFGSQPATARAEAAAAVTDSSAKVPQNPYASPAELKGHLPKEIIMYQYEACPFCHKVKAFLDYHKIPYRCVEVNPLTKKEISFTQYRKVPVVLLDGEQINDSSVIISRLSAELEQQQQQQQRQEAAASSSGGWLSALFGSSSSSGSGSNSARQDGAEGAAKKREEEERWRRWVDDWFVKSNMLPSSSNRGGRVSKPLQVITVNIYRNATESFQTFDYITKNGNFSWWEREAARIVGATMMWGLSGKLKKKYNVEGNVRDNLYKSANEWVEALGDRRFLGGQQPNNADLSMFGVIRAVTGTPTFHDLMHNTRIGAWYEHMMGAVGESARLQ
ncbi:hypothetical protein N2152v2_007050 [Parachlorella kessleri]